MQISAFYSKLNKRGEGVNKKSTFYTLAKRLKIVEHPLPHPKKSIYHKLALKKEDGIFHPFLLCAHLISHISVIIYCRIIRWLTF